MSSRSNDQGRAFEFAILTVLEREIRKNRPVQVKMDESFDTCQRAWNTVDYDMQKNYISAVLAGVEELYKLEPLLLEGTDKLELSIQKDSQGEEGDVRDVILIRDEIGWEIGLSAKHNHRAVKHSRLSERLDFGDKWYGIACSSQYWDDISPIFERLRIEKTAQKKWSDLSDKIEAIYKPLLEAFKKEIITQDKNNPNYIPKLLVEYLLGRKDFYKFIGIDNSRVSEIQSYNLQGTLNLPGNIRNVEIEVPQAELPTEIISFDYKQGSDTTLVLALNKGWSFSFRIHNASAKVETSLKFDVQLINTPEFVKTIICPWKD